METILHSQDIETADKRLQLIPDKIKGYATAQNSAAGGKMFPADHYTIAALSRTWTNLAAFNALLDLKNMSSLRTLARVQIDTLARYHAMWLVDCPHEFALTVMRGEHVGKIKDSSGKNMQDHYLINNLSKECPWLPDVYKNLCGYVHFSNVHIFTAVEKIDEDTIRFCLKGEDDDYPMSSWIEIRDCFSEATENLFRYVEGWIKTKMD